MTLPRHREAARALINGYYNSDDRYAPRLIRLVADALAVAERRGAESMRERAARVLDGRMDVDRLLNPTHQVFINPQDAAARIRALSTDDEDRDEDRSEGGTTT